MTSLTSERTLDSELSQPVNILAPKEITSNLGVTSRCRGGTEPISEDKDIAVKECKQKLETLNEKGLNNVTCNPTSIGTNSDSDEPGVIVLPESVGSMGVTSRRRGGTEPPCGKLISEDNGIVSIKSKKQRNRNPEGKGKQKGKI